MRMINNFQKCFTESNINNLMLLQGKLILFHKNVELSEKCKHQIVIHWMKFNKNFKMVMIYLFLLDK